MLRHQNEKCKEKVKNLLFKIEEDREKFLVEIFCQYKIIEEKENELYSFFFGLVFSSNRFSERRFQ